MSASILSTILLVSPASVPVAAQPPSLVEPESGAWAVVHAGQLFVCWSPGPDCFERVVLDDDSADAEHTLDEDDPLDSLDPLDPLDAASPSESQLDAQAWQLGFWGAGSLWIERDERRWRVSAGQRRARLVVDPAPIRLRRIFAATCSPSGLVPAVIGGRLSWREAPRCALELPAQTCVSAAAPRTRAPTAVRLRAGIEIGSTRGWTAQDELALGLAIAGRRRTSDVEVSFVVELGFDWQRRTDAARARALLERRGRSRARELPPVAPGPRAQAELEALARVVCHGGRP